MQVDIQFRESDQVMRVTLSEAEQVMEIFCKEEISVIEGQPYKGSYQVEPSTRNNVTLETENTFVEENIVVLQIPYAEVTNNSGGKTATIGNEV